MNHAHSGDRASVSFCDVQFTGQNNSSIQSDLGEIQRMNTILKNKNFGSKGLMIARGKNLPIGNQAEYAKVNGLNAKNFYRNPKLKPQDGNYLPYQKRSYKKLTVKEKNILLSIAGQKPQESEAKVVHHQRTRPFSSMQPKSRNVSVQPKQRLRNQRRFNSNTLQVSQNPTLATITQSRPRTGNASKSKATPRALGLNKHSRHQSEGAVKMISKLTKNSSKPRSSLSSNQEVIEQCFQRFKQNEFSPNYFTNQLPIKEKTLLEFKSLSLQRRNSTDDSPARKVVYIHGHHPSWSTPAESLKQPRQSQNSQMSVIDKVKKTKLFKRQAKAQTASIVNESALSVVAPAREKQKKAKFNKMKFNKGNPFQGLESTEIIRGTVEVTQYTESQNDKKADTPVDSAPLSPSPVILSRKYSPQKPSDQMMSQLLDKKTNSYKQRPTSSVSFKSKTLRMSFQKLGKFEDQQRQSQANVSFRESLNRDLTRQSNDFTTFYKSPITYQMTQLSPEQKQHSVNLKGVINQFRVQKEEQYSYQLRGGHNQYLKAMMHNMLLKYKHDKAKLVKNTRMHSSKKVEFSRKPFQSAISEKDIQSQSASSKNPNSQVKLKQVVDQLQNSPHTKEHGVTTELGDVENLQLNEHSQTLLDQTKSGGDLKSLASTFSPQNDFQLGSYKLKNTKVIVSKDSSTKDYSQLKPVNNNRPRSCFLGDRPQSSKDQNLDSTLGKEILEEDQPITPSNHLNVPADWDKGELRIGMKIVNNQGQTSQEILQEDVVTRQESTIGRLSSRTPGYYVMQMQMLHKMNSNEENLTGIHASQVTQQIDETPSLKNMRVNSWESVGKERRTCSQEQLQRRQ